jgi:hypothetical protein
MTKGNTILVRKEISILFKNTKYLVCLNGDDVRELNSVNNKIEFDVYDGRHKIEIKNKLYSETTELIVQGGQTKKIIIFPSLKPFVRRGLIIVFILISLIKFIYKIDITSYSVFCTIYIIMILLLNKDRHVSFTVKTI